MIKDSSGLNNFFNNVTIPKLELIIIDEFLQDRQQFSTYFTNDFDCKRLEIKDNIKNLTTNNDNFKPIYTEKILIKRPEMNIFLPFSCCVVDMIRFDENMAKLIEERDFETHVILIYSKNSDNNQKLNYFNKIQPIHCVYIENDNRDGLHLTIEDFFQNKTYSCLQSKEKKFITDCNNAIKIIFDTLINNLVFSPEKYLKDLKDTYKEKNEILSKKFHSYIEEQYYNNNLLRINKKKNRIYIFHEDNKEYCYKIKLLHDNIYQIYPIFKWLNSVKNCAKCNRKIEMHTVNDYCLVKCSREKYKNQLHEYMYKQTIILKKQLDEAKYEIEKYKTQLNHDVYKKTKDLKKQLDEAKSEIARLKNILLNKVGKLEIQNLPEKILIFQKKNEKLNDGSNLKNYCDSLEKMPKNDRYEKKIYNPEIDNASIQKISESQKKKEQLLNDIDLYMNNYKKFIFIGESGSGKTSIILNIIRILLSCKINETFDLDSLLFTENVYCKSDDMVKHYFLKDTYQFIELPGVLPLLGNDLDDKNIAICIKNLDKINRSACSIIFVQKSDYLHACKSISSIHDYIMSINYKFKIFYIFTFYVGNLVFKTDLLPFKPYKTIKINNIDVNSLKSQKKEKFYSVLQKTQIKLKNLIDLATKDSEEKDPKQHCK